MIALQRNLIDMLIERALMASPEEMCGLVIGRMENEAKIAEQLVFLDNVNSNPLSEYTADSSQLLEEVNLVEESGKSLLGIFHSHPHGNCAPSNIDSERVRWYDYSHIIVAPNSTEPVCSWLWEEAESRFIKEELRII